MIFLLSGDFDVFEVVRQKGEADLGSNQQGVLGARWLDLRGAVCFVATGIVSGLLAVTKAAQRVLRTDLDHFLG
jgi:hypothetical protein